MKQALVIGIAIFGSWIGSAAAQAPARLAHGLYPLKIGEQWTYRVTDMKTPLAKPDPKKIVKVEVEKEEVYTRKTVLNAKETVEKFVGYVLKSNSGDKVTRDVVVILSNGFYRLSVAGTPMTPPMPFFEVPQKAGLDSWEWDYDGTLGGKQFAGKFKASYERITVPAKAGKPIEAIKVAFRSTDGTGVEIESWFASDLGMVKQHIKTRDHEIMLELLQFKAGK